MNYLCHLIVLVEIYALLAVSLNLLVGLGGLLSLSHAAFAGLGGYTAALLSSRLGFPFPLALLASVVVGAATSLAAGLPSLRLRGDHFVLATLGIQAVLSAVFLNWTSLTGGPYGIPGIPLPRFLTIEVASPAGFALLYGALCGAVLFCLAVVGRSPFGRLLRSIRDDAVAARSLGKPVRVVELQGFVIASAAASIAGGLLAFYLRYIDPGTFDLDRSILILAAVVIGGAGTFIGPLIGSTFVVLVPEALRFLDLPESIGAPARQIVYGLAIIGLMRWRPRGLAGDYDFD